MSSLGLLNTFICRFFRRAAPERRQQKENDHHDKKNERKKSASWAFLPRHPQSSRRAIANSWMRHYSQERTCFVLEHEPEGHRHNGWNDGIMGAPVCMSDGAVTDTVTNLTRRVLAAKVSLNRRKRIISLSPSSAKASCCSK